MRFALTKFIAFIFILNICIICFPSITTRASVDYYKIKGEWVGFDKEKGKITYAPINFIPKKIAGVKVKIIGKWAYNKNDELEEIKIPKSVKKIEQGAFYRCKNLKKVSFAKNSKAKIAADAFGECANLEIVENNPSSDWLERMESLNRVTDLLSTLDTQKIRDSKSTIWLVERLTNDNWDVISKKAQELAGSRSTEMDKAKAIYDWVSSIPYDEEWRKDHSKPLEQNPYNLITWNDAEHGGKKVCTDCVGHTVLTLVLLDSIDIPCVYVYRQMKGEETVGHGWNTAYIEGRWIWIDSTQEFFDPGLAGFVCDSDHKRVDQVNRINVEEYSDSLN